MFNIFIGNRQHNWYMKENNNKKWKVNIFQQEN